MSVPVSRLLKWNTPRNVDTILSPASFKTYFHITHQRHKRHQRHPRQAFLRANIRE